MIKKLPSGEMHGRILKAQIIADFVLTETLYLPQSRLEKHSHENAYFCVVLQGSYTEHYGRKELDCQPRTLLFRPSHEVHEDRFHGAGGRCFIMEIAPRRIEQMREHSLNLNEAADFRGGLSAQLISRLNKEFHLMDGASALAIEGLALEIMAETARHLNVTERGVPNWLKQVRELLHERFDESLTLDEIASAVAVHPVYLASVFRQKFHCTVGEYVRQLKIEFACREISFGKGKSLTEIALTAGFADQSHFTKIFKRQMGMTPAGYRKNFHKS